MYRLPEGWKRDKFTSLHYCPDCELPEWTAEEIEEMHKQMEAEDE